MLECNSELCELAIDIGEALLINGAEIHRVEDTITRICKSAGAEETEVFCMIKAIVVTVKCPGGTAYTTSRRITATENNFKRIDKLNTLSRRICEGKYNLAGAKNKLWRIKNGYECPFIKKLIGYIVLAFFSTMFFGGSFFDAVMSMPAAVFMALYNKVMKRTGVNRSVYNFVACVLSGIIIMLIYKLGAPIHISSVITGSLMILIPGLTLSVCIEDLLMGDTTSGILNICESLLASVSIALGYALSLNIFGITNAISEPIVYSLPILLILSLSVSLGYALMGNVSSKTIFFASIGGIITYLVYFFVFKVTANNFVSVFIAATAGALYSRIQANVFHSPATVFSTPSMIPLAPGNALYLTIANAITGNRTLTEHYLVETLLTASGIALGLLTVGLLFQLINLMLREVKERRSGSHKKIKIEDNEDE